jgi:hypothetical protein
LTQVLVYPDDSIIYRFSRKHPQGHQQRAHKLNITPQPEKPKLQPFFLLDRYPPIRKRDDSRTSPGTKQIYIKSQQKCFTPPNGEEVLGPVNHSVLFGNKRQQKKISSYMSHSMST